MWCSRPLLNWRQDLLEAVWQKVFQFATASPFLSQGEKGLPPPAERGKGAEKCCTDLGQIA